MTGEEAGKVARAAFTGDGCIDGPIFDALARDLSGLPWFVMLQRLKTWAATGTGYDERAGAPLYANPWLHPTPLGPTIRINPGPAR